MNFRICFILFFTPIIFFSCKKNSTNNIVANTGIGYEIGGAKILYNNKPVQLIGANAFHIFSAGSNDMNAWNIDLAREFVGNVKEAPLTGSSIKDANGSYLYSLQNVADSNRQNNRITIFCAFGWDGTSATEFTGKMPTLTFWWNDFKTKLQQWANQFKNQNDVWLEVWNEPYRWDRADGYTDDIWVNDMTVLVNIIRQTGNQNIILVPCAEQGQDESVLINKGSTFIQGKSNILFDVHAYEKWLLVPNANVGNRLGQLSQNRLPIFFGETAPINSSGLMNPKTFLDSISNRGISISAWVWKTDGTDQDALLNADKSPNNNNNNYWGTTFKTLSLSPRKP